MINKQIEEQIEENEAIYYQLEKMGREPAYYYNGAASGSIDLIFMFNEEYLNTNGKKELLQRLQDDHKYLKQKLKEARE